MRILLSEAQFVKLMNEMKKEDKPWYKNGSDWDWTDEDEKAVEKMKQDSIAFRKAERKKKHDEFIKLIKGDKKEVKERSRSFAFTRKKRLFSYPEVNANPLRYKKSTRKLKGVDDLNEQKGPELNVQKDGTNVNINGQKYKLQIFKLGGWKDVDVDDIKNTTKGVEVKASLGFISQTDLVPLDTVNVIKMNVGKPEINLGGKTPKKLVKLTN